MKSNSVHYLIISLMMLTVGYQSPVIAVTDAELEALEKQIDQQEMEEKKQAEIDAKRKAATDADNKRLFDLEKQRRIEQKQLKEEKKKLEAEKKKIDEEKRKVEEARQSDLDRKRQEEEAKQLALKEQKRKEEEVAKARVTVILFRAASYVGSLTTVPMKHNDNNIDTLSNGSFFIITIPPGKHTFSTNSGYENYEIDKSFDFEPGQLYYIQLGVGFSFTIKLISNTEGRSGIKGLKNVGKINPADVFSDYDESEAYKENTSIQNVPL